MPNSNLYFFTKNMSVLSLVGNPTEHWSAENGGEQSLSVPFIPKPWLIIFDLFLVGGQLTCSRKH